MEPKGEKLKGVKEGQDVFIPSLNQKAIVLSKPSETHQEPLQGDTGVLTW